MLTLPSNGRSRCGWQWSRFQSVQSQLRAAVIWVAGVIDRSRDGITDF
jgi:hypothetical protein